MESRPTGPAASRPKRRAARAVLSAIAAGLDSVIRLGEIGAALRFPRRC